MISSERLLKYDVYNTMKCPRPPKVNAPYSAEGTLDISSVELSQTSCNSKLEQLFISFNPIRAQCNYFPGFSIFGWKFDEINVLDQITLSATA